MEDEVGYLKIQVWNGLIFSVINIEVCQLEKFFVMKVEKFFFVEENMIFCDVKVFVDFCVFVILSFEFVKFEYYFVGVFLKGRGGYEIYIQDVNVLQGMSQVKFYVFMFNQSSIILGYGKIVSVMKLFFFML